MYKTILAATDGTDHGDRVVGVAAHLAVSSGARLILLHVATESGSEEDLKRFAEVEGIGKDHAAGAPPGIPVATPQGGVASPGAAEAGVDRQAVVRELAGRVVREARETATSHGAETVDEAVELGDPAERIVERAKHENADAVVIGGSSRESAKDAILGSVSQEVCRTFDGPCIVVT